MIIIIFFFSLQIVLIFPIKKWEKQPGIIAFWFPYIMNKESSSNEPHPHASHVPATVQNSTLEDTMSQLQPIISQVSGNWSRCMPLEVTNVQGTWEPLANACAVMQQACQIVSSSLFLHVQCQRSWTGLGPCPSWMMPLASPQWYHQRQCHVATQGATRISYDGLSWLSSCDLALGESHSAQILNKNSCRDLFEWFLQNHTQSGHLGSQAGVVSLRIPSEQHAAASQPHHPFPKMSSSKNTNRCQKEGGDGEVRTFHPAVELEALPLEHTAVSVVKSKDAISWNQRKLQCLIKFILLKSRYYTWLFRQGWLRKFLLTAFSSSATWLG